MRIAVVTVTLGVALGLSAGIIGAAKAAVVPGARVAVTGYRIKDAAELRKTVRRFKGDVNPNTVEARGLQRVDGSFAWPIPAPPRPMAPNCDP